MHAPTSTTHRCDCLSVVPGANDPDRSKCVSCPLGQFSDYHGWLYCKPCAPGSFNNGFYGAACGSCPLGRSTANKAGAQTDCDACPPGTHANVTGMPACLSCGVGKSQGLDGRAQCNNCSVGEYGNSTGARSCRACGPGRAQGAPGKTSCALCATARAPGPSRAQCEACAAGRFGTSPGSASCTSCRAGFYAPALKMEFCLRCLAGRSTDGQAGQADCAECQPGKYAGTQAMESVAGMAHLNASLSVLTIVTALPVHEQYLHLQRLPSSLHQTHASVRMSVVLTLPTPLWSLPPGTKGLLELAQELE